ncbi:peptidylprolyl isomerase [Sphingomonas sp. GB1N7]|uniref:peptidylprolyl isomerase n=1 Tax=Parasphingomonas caseinilytica TaxID=3096158 RepID=UPI002FCA6470
MISVTKAVKTGRAVALLAALSVTCTPIGGMAQKAPKAKAPAKTPATKTPSAKAPAAQADPRAPDGAAPENTVADNGVPDVGLNIPDNLQLYGKLDPNVRKPTAIVNETVITGTDVDQRLALAVAINGWKLSPEDTARLRTQTLNQLIDETLQIQEAKASEVVITPAELSQSFNGVAKNFSRSPEQMRTYLRQVNSSERSLKRQIEGELAWQRYLRRKVEPTVNVSEEEVKSILKRLQDSKGTQEYHVNEIYIHAEPAQAAQIAASITQMIDKIQKGEAPFGYFARTFSEATTKSVDGDLGWVRSSQLPDELARAAESMQVGQIAGPIAVAGGFSVLYLVDKRQVLTADPRDAKLALKQITVRFPAGTTQTQATERVAAFAAATKAMQGCGDVAKVAASLGGDVVDSDSATIRDLPPALQDIMLKLAVGQSTPPFGSAQDGVRALVLCGRDEPRGGDLPNSSRLQEQMEQQRVNLRAQQLLRDLRRDAIVEYR